MQRDQAAISVSLARRDDDELRAITAIERECFPEREPDVVGELKRPWAKLWVAKFGDASLPGAYLLAWVVADEIHVLSVATTSSMRRRGLGRALMDAVIEEARAQRSEIMLLEVRRSNRAAIALYRGLGFRAISIRRGYYSDLEDGVEMMLVFDPDTGEIQWGRDEVRLEESES